LISPLLGASLLFAFVAVLSAVVIGQQPVKESVGDTTTAQRAAEHAPPATRLGAAYRIVETEDLSFGRTGRSQLRIEVDGAKSESELRAICNEILGARSYLCSENAVAFLFYLPGTNTNGCYTAGTATWAPEGVWGHAVEVRPGDCSRHQLSVEAGNALGALVVEEAPLPESQRRQIFYELVVTQDSGVDDFKAYTIIARRHGVPEKMMYQIAGEGVAKGWPMPAASW
jgi:hypothetical protein